MATNIVKMQIQFRRDTAYNWELHKDVVPADGEPCFVVDKNILKIGDGVTTFEHLEPINGVKFELAADGKSLVLNDNVLKLMGFDTAAVGSYPRKSAEGFIEWAVPAADENIDRLLIEVNALRMDTTSLQTDVADLKEIVSPSGEGAVSLLTRIESIENKVDGTGEGTIDAMIDAKINEFANKVSGDGVVNTLKELVDYVADHGPEVADMASDILTLQQLVGNTSVNDQIVAAVNASGHVAEKKANAVFEHVKYEVSSKPEGTLVDYRDKEIRIMCPSDTNWVKQNVGDGGDGSKHYIGFKAYAPEGAVSFKEDLAEVIADNTMHSFSNNDFAGTDEYGRKYSIVWLPVASYDSETDSWTYYGANSNNSKYIGWHYSVEWYGANGKKIGSDCIRINLSNESCHSTIEPFYAANAIKGVKVNGTLLDTIDGIVDISIAEQSLGVKGSDEIDVAEDGTLTIKSISFSKVVQSETEVIVMDGGSAG